MHTKTPIISTVLLLGILKRGPAPPTDSQISPIRISVDKFEESKPSGGRSYYRLNWCEISACPPRKNDLGLYGENV